MRADRQDDGRDHLRPAGRPAGWSARARRVRGDEVSVAGAPAAGRRPVRALAAGIALLMLAGCASMSTSASGTAAAAELRSGARAAGRDRDLHPGRGTSCASCSRHKGCRPGSGRAHPRGRHLRRADLQLGAGGHFNPLGKQHEITQSAGRPRRRSVNITIGADGTGRLETTTPLVTLGAGSTSLFDVKGSALVIHAAPDDFRTDPPGTPAHESPAG